MTPEQLLQQITIARPCPADWAGMSGNDQVRFCGQCQKHVYNIAEIPPAEAVSLIQESEGDLCVRLYQRRDGTVLNGDCPVGVRQVWSRWKRLVGVATAAGIMALAAKVAPSLEAGVPRVHAAAPVVPAGPGPVMLALHDFMATLKDWLGITPESPPPMGAMTPMGQVCLPAGGLTSGSDGFVDEEAGPPAPPAAVRSSDS